jgi:hypothetical protein
MHENICSQEGSLDTDEMRANVARAKGNFQITSWAEEKFGGPAGSVRLARLTATHDFAGDIEGESMVEYVLIYTGDKPISFTGFERFAGKVAEKEGTFVLQVDGAYLGSDLQANWSVVPGSGTGDLEHIRGDGAFGPTRGSVVPFTLEYDLRKPRQKKAA